MKELILKLTPQQVEIIIRSLAKQPYEVVGDIIPNIQVQCRAQFDKKDEDESGK